MKKYITIPLILIALVGGFLIFDSNHPHAQFSENWQTISQDFGIINEYAMTKFPDEKNYIELSDLNDSNDRNINNSLSAVQDYLKKYFDKGSYIQMSTRVTPLSIPVWNVTSIFWCISLTTKRKLLNITKNLNYPDKNIL